MFSYKMFLCSFAVKPNAPTITSVKDSNGNFIVSWRTNMKRSFSQSLIAEVTWRKKGDVDEVRHQRLFVPKKQTWTTGGYKHVKQHVDKMVT